ncbi:hypothetical protein V8E36_004183 [Tilletia maclaganii]
MSSNPKPRLTGGWTQDHTASGETTPSHSPDHRLLDTEEQKHPDSENNIAFHTPDKADRRARSNVRTVATIIGGWGLIVIACIVSKVACIATNHHVSDSWAEYVLRHPQTSTQLWTMVGNMLAEVCLILWSMSIAYMAFRAVVFSKDKVELLTIAAWTELNRAGYTFSRRRPIWPVITLIICECTYQRSRFVPNTELTDRLQSIGIDGCAVYALNVFNTNLSGSTQDVFERSNIETVQICHPSATDGQGMIKAATVGVQTLLTDRETLFTLPPKYQINGRTWGLVPLGPAGFDYLSDPDLRSPPPGTPTPEGYDHTYELVHQGLTTNVTCHSTSTAEQALIQINKGTRADESLYTVRCPYGGQAAPTNLSVMNPGNATIVSNLAALPCPFSNGVEESARTHTLFIQAVQPDANDALQGAPGSMTYPSTDNVLEVSDSQFLAYMDQEGDINAAPSQGRWDRSSNQSYTRGYIAANTFASAVGVINSLNLASGFAPSAQNAINGEGIVSGNFYYQFLVTKSMFDYESSLLRAFQMARLRPTRSAAELSTDTANQLPRAALASFIMVGDQYNDPSVARRVLGTWQAETLGWGAGALVRHPSPWNYRGIALWSHWRYRASRGYYGDFDPTDITQAIIASSAGGLSTAFDRRALADDQGLYGARKVSVRLGRVLDANDPDGKPRLGFVQYD